MSDRALINTRRIDEAVADDPIPAFERRPDRIGHVISPGGCEQHSFGIGAERLGPAVEQNMPNDLSSGRTTRLARQHDRNCKRSQPLS